MSLGIRCGLCLAAAVTTLATALTDHGSAADARGTVTVLQAAPVLSLLLSEVKTPPIHSVDMRTSGTYPRVSLPGLNLRRPNALLRKAILVDQRSWFRGGSPAKAHAHVTPGLYQTSTEARLISASTVVVSALIPALEIPPSGNDGARWISATIDVHMGRSVGITALFTHPAEGLRSLARAARLRLAAANRCVRGSLADRTMSFSEGFNPTKFNYRYFALLPNGLAIGFPLGQVSGPACGRVEVTVPYSVLGHHLSNLGRRLVAGVRPAIG